MQASIADPCATDPRFYRPGRRASARARRREEQALAEALARNILGFAHGRRWCMATGEHLVDEVSVAWPRAFKAASSAASALAAAHDPTLADTVVRWMLSADHGGVSRRLKLSLLMPPALRQDSRLVDTVLGSLENSGLRPELLEVRFVETALVACGTEALLCLSALRDAGIGTAVDDWGRRYGSLSMLRDVPLTTVRLDPALTYDVAEDQGQAALAAAVIRTAHAFQLQVVAQGVDNEADRAALSCLGVDAATGRLAP